MSKTVTIQAAAPFTFHGTLRSFREKYPEAEVRSIDGEEYVGGCEVCGLPIYGKTKFWRDSDGIVWHKRCPKDDA